MDNATLGEHANDLNVRRPSREGIVMRLLRISIEQLMIVIALVALDPVYASSVDGDGDVLPNEPGKHRGSATKTLGQETGGIGIALAKEQEALVIRSILPDSVAAMNKAICLGDRVIAVADDNKPAVRLRGKTVAEAVRLIRGTKGTTIRLTLVPAGKDEGQARVVSVVRGELRDLSDQAVALKELPGWGDGVLLSPGSEAPNLQMTSLTGNKSEHLADFKGKVVVLEFWATWCAPCQKLMADLQSYSENNPEWKDEVVLIAASVDEDHDSVVKYLKAKGWNKTHNVQVGIRAKKAYHVGAVPTQYIIDKHGKIVGSDHSQDAATIVKALLRGKRGTVPGIEESRNASAPARR